MATGSRDRILKSGLQQEQLSEDSELVSERERNKKKKKKKKTKKTW